MNNPPKISRSRALFKALKDKDFKQNQANQRRLLTAIKENSVADVKGMLTDKKACPSSPVWFKKRGAWEGFLNKMFMDDDSGTTVFVSPIYFLLNHTNTTLKDRSLVLKCLLEEGAIITEQDLTPSFFYPFTEPYARTNLNLGDRKQNIGMIVLTLSQYGIDWSKIFEKKSEYNRVYPASAIAKAVGADDAQKMGISFDEDGVPFNNLKDRSTTYDIKCLSPKTNFLPKVFTDILKNHLSISLGKAQSMVDNFVSGKEIVIPCPNEQQNQYMSSLLDETGVFSSQSASLSPSPLSSSIVLVNRQNDKQENTPTPLLQKNQSQ